MNNKYIIEKFSKLTDPEWRKVLEKSVHLHSIEGVKLPRFAEVSIQNQYTGSHNEQTLREMSDFYSLIKSISHKHGKEINLNTKILDFGCGWGRTIRFFLKDIMSENIYGTDVSESMINICKESFNCCNFSTNNALPTTSTKELQQANFFDVIYAYSVFTHLSEESHIKWIKELSRILKPGGILITTVQKKDLIPGLIRKKQIGLEISEWENGVIKKFENYSDKDYENGTYIFRSDTPNGHYGDTISPIKYIQKEWPKTLNFKEYITENTIQAIVVMQKNEQ